MEKDWIPASPGTSLYIAPPSAWTRLWAYSRAKEYLLYVILSPVGAYYASRL